MIENLSLALAVVSLVAVTALGGSRIVLGERHSGDGVAVAGPRPRRLQLVDRSLAVASVLLLVAFGAYLVAGVK